MQQPGVKDPPAPTPLHLLERTEGSHPTRTRGPLGHPPRRTCRRRTGALDELCWLSRRTATLRAVLAIAPGPLRTEPSSHPPEPYAPGLTREGGAGGAGPVLKEPQRTRPRKAAGKGCRAGDPETRRKETLGHSEERLL